MELSGLELRYLVNEIASKVTNGYYVSQVNAVTKDSLLLKLHHPTQEDIMLVISVRGIWITKLKFKPVEDNSLERAAITELERAKIESIEQAGSERIVSIKFQRLDGQTRIVVCEFFGDGNIVICNEGMKILAILCPIQVRHRTLAVGLKYAFPPSRGIDVFQLSLEQLLSLQDRSGSLDVLRWLGRGISMPKKFVEEVVRRTGIEGSREAGSLTEDEVARLHLTIKALVDAVIIGRNHQPLVVMQDGKPIDAFPIMMYETNKHDTKGKSTFMEALDEVLSTEILDVGRSSKTIELDRQIAILEHDLKEQEKAKEAVLQKAQAIRKLAGELMTASYSQGNLDNILEANSATITSDKGIKYVQIAGEMIELQDNLAKLSSMLFIRAKEMERGNSSIEEARSKLLMQIDKLRSQTAAIHKKIVVKTQARKEWYERYRWFITSDGYLAIGGRDASSNSALVRKHLTEDDVVFHAEVHGSPFFIVKNALSPAQQGLIEKGLAEVAQATVAFSRAWKDGLSSADAYWVLPEQVKKGAPTGQFLPKGSFVIEGKRNYVKGIEIRLAIGIVSVDGRQVLACGPEGAIKRHALVYAVLQQGGMDPMNAAKKIKSSLVATAASSDEVLGENIKHISLDDFVRALPTGQTRVSFAASSKGN